MRHTGPKNKLSRREGIDLGLKTTGSKAHASLMKRINIKPGQKPNSRFSKLTEYGRQLREKQKLRRMYGLTEKQLKKYFDESNRLVGNTGHLLMQRIERRLDNVVYKLGFAPTRAAARQLVNHGHIGVNDKKVSIPSYILKEGEIITFRKADTAKIPYIASLLAQKDLKTPEWLERKATTGRVVGDPEAESFHDGIDLQAVIEFYSR